MSPATAGKSGWLAKKFRIAEGTAGGFISSDTLGDSLRTRMNADQKTAEPKKDLTQGLRAHHGCQKTSGKGLLECKGEGIPHDKQREAYRHHRERQGQSQFPARE